MPTLIAGLVALYLLLAAIKQFGRMSPATAAKIMRRGGGGALSALTLVMFALRGRASLLAALANLAFIAAQRRRAGPSASSFASAGPGGRASRVSSARSAMIETRLDLDSGAMSGLVLSGRFQGRPLDMLTRPECLELHADCRHDDPDGALLLEAYLDRRFAGWRDADERQGEARGRTGGGAMTRNEAHEVLGVAQGASADEIIRAHRTLMKKFHPDHGGSTAEAARINQAKDVLLNRHGRV